jgi:hypothetical protein
MRNAITVCSVMAFSFVAFAAWSAEPETAEVTDDSPQFADVTPCANWHVGKLVRAPAGSKLVAAYAEEGNDVAWVRILQRGKKYTLEVSTPKARRRNIDPQLAKRISSRLADDIARNAFVFASNEVQMDGIWYAYTADGKSCATMGMIHRNDRAVAWSTIFSWLFDDDVKSEARALFWLNQLEQTPATLPTSLAELTSEHAVIGAASSWKHAGSEPLPIVNHRARVDDDEIEIIGELKNGMDTAREATDVIATIYDAAGAVLLEEKTPVYLMLLPAGMRSPFSLSVPRKGAAAYTLRVEPGWETKVNPPTMRIVEHHLQVDEEDEDYLRISGTVRNDGKSEEKFVQVYVNFYDESGRLLLGDSDFVSKTDGLPPGASGKFEVLEERPAGYDHYEVFIDPDYRESRD